MVNDISLFDPIGLLAIAIAFVLGGILKGATGAGLPIITVPVIAAFYDVRVAVVMMVVPNFLTNMFQLYRYRSNNEVPELTRNFVIAGVIGAGIGSLLLAWVPLDALNLFMAVVISVYIATRLAKPALQIPRAVAARYAWIGGGGGGILQGAVGVSAPMAVTYLSAVRLPRPVFIMTISAFFAAMCLIQLPVQMIYGLVSWHSILLGTLALAPLFAGLSLGEWVGKRLSPAVFDKIVLIMLAILALRQFLRVLG